MQYSEEDKAKLFSIPIEDIMARYGCRTDHSRTGMYYSPFRDERTPSFHLDVRTNRWYDFGLQEGGGIVAFVCRLTGCRRSDVLDWLNEHCSGALAVNVVPLPERHVQKQKSRIISIDNQSHEFTRNSLLRYAGERGISREVLETYCYQVSYSFSTGACNSYCAIGFPNDEGGFTLRSRTRKRSTSCAPTTISADGMHTRSVTSGTVAVFEGFMDFLSWVEMGGQDTDCCVLNSVSNLKRALGWISEHDLVESYLDNDDAGRRALEEMREWCSLSEGIKVNDMSHLFSPHKDLNEMYVCDLGKQKCETINNTSYGTDNIKGHPAETGQNQLG